MTPAAAASSKTTPPATRVSPCPPESVLVLTGPRASLVGLADSEETASPTASAASSGFVGCLRRLWAAGFVASGELEEPRVAEGEPPVAVGVELGMGDPGCDAVGVGLDVPGVAGWDGFEASPRGSEGFDGSGGWEGVGVLG
jgi:hypothetical protein